MNTLMSPEEWNEQFTRQAGWTRETRAHLYRRANLLRARRILDVGSGTGAVTEEMAARTSGEVIGVDIDPAMVAYAQARGTQAAYQLGNAHDLPFPDAWFDVTACHFLLMWCDDPLQAAREMVRVTHPEGAVLVCAEPDYGGRIDHPDLPIADWQVESLRREGAEPCLGRKLRALFDLPGVRRADVGVIPGLWDIATLRAEFEAEWSLWERSMATFVSQADLARAKAIDLAATESGARLAFMPVFYALIRV